MRDMRNRNIEIIDCYFDEFPNEAYYEFGDPNYFDGHDIHRNYEDIKSVNKFRKSHKGFNGHNANYHHNELKERKETLYNSVDLYIEKYGVDAFIDFIKLSRKIDFNKVYEYLLDMIEELEEGDF